MNLILKIIKTTKKKKIYIYIYTLYYTRLYICYLIINRGLNFTKKKLILYLINYK